MSDNEREDVLREIFPKGSVAYTVLLHVNRDGDNRSIKLLGVKDGGIRNVSGLVSEVLGYKFDRNRGGVWVGGGGMDMGFSLVYDLSRKIHGDGYAVVNRWL